VSRPDCRGLRLAEAHTALGGVLHRVDWDREGAEREFRRAVELNPGYITAHQWYAILLAEAGRDADALRHAERAVALDPLSGLMHQALGLIHLFGRRFDRAVAEERRPLELAPQLGPAPQFLAQPGSLRSLKVDPLSDGVRNDPRFADLTRRAGL
jgi:tetratricopeptide (TPR) repeat protein